MASPLHSFLRFLRAYPEIALSIASFLFLRLYLLYRSSPSPVNWPIIGMLPGLLAHFHHLHDYIAAILCNSGGTLMFYGPRLLDMEMLITADPANINHILSGNFSNYHKGESFNEVFDIFGDGLFNTDAESWKIQRKLANVYIGDRRYRSFVAAATRAKATNGLLPILRRAAETGEVVEIQDLFMRLSFDVTCRMVFGVDPRALTPEFPSIPFAVAIDDAWEAMLFRHATPKILWKTLRWLNVGAEKRMAEAWRVIDDFIGRIIAERKEERRIARSQNMDDDSTPAMMTDILTSYIDHVVDEVDDRFEPDKFLRDTVLAFMIAGRDGFAICLSWFFYLLHKNPRVEAKLMEELALHAAPSRPDEGEDGEGASQPAFDGEAIGKMVYLHGAVCEALRIYPPVPAEEKVAIDADVLPSGDEVSGGLRILLSAYAMGRMEEIWGKDCIEFKPERWITEEGRIKHVPAYKFMAFNAGPRICPGRDVALTQIKTVAAAVMWEYKVEVVDEAAVAPKNAVMIRMQNGMMVKIRPRN